MITSDPYGISGAVAPWRSLDAMEPITERRITERDTEEAELCGRCPLPDCNPKRVGCLLHTRGKGQNRPVICWSAWRWTGMGRRR